MRQKTIDFLKSGNEIAGINGNQWLLLGKKDIPKNPDAGLLVQDTSMPWVKNEIPGYSEHDFKRMFLNFSQYNFRLINSDLVLRLHLLILYTWAIG